VPVLLVTGQVNHDRLHQECGAYHEIDLEGILRPCTRYATTVMSNDQLPAAVRSAFEAMTTGRPRPAALILPQDLIAQECLASFPPASVGEVQRGGDDTRIPQQANTPHPGPPPQGGREKDNTKGSELIEQAAHLLAGAARPILLAGGGAVWSGAAP